MPVLAVRPRVEGYEMDALWQLPAKVVAELVRSRTVSAREVTESTLARLEAVNPAINAVVDPMPEAALAAADTLDAAPGEGTAAGPLAGVPVTIKVNVDCQGRATTNGLRQQAHHRADADNPVVANLRRAGAVIVGRTNTPAFSIRWFCRNSLHGDTLNPHDAGLTPGGSSGGAGAAVAAGIGALAHGTDIAGSVRYPAYACNVHGLRPTLGRVPAANLSFPDRGMGAQLTAVSGPLARRIDDLAIGLEAMAMPDWRDPWHIPIATNGAPLPRRVAFDRAPDGLAVDPAVTAALEAAAAALEHAGYVVEEVPVPPFREAAALNMALWMAEFREAGLPKLEVEGDPDAIEVAGRLLALGAVAGPMEALQRRVALIRSWQGFLEDWPIVLCPVSAVPPFAAHADLGGEAAFAAVYEAQLIQVALPLLALPGLTVATGAPGRPMGVQLIGPRYREDALLDAGRAIEAAGPKVAPVDPFPAAAGT
ncbi:MAG: amidase [Pseudomonadota bacterium]